MRVKRTKRKQSKFVKSCNHHNLLMRKYTVQEQIALETQALDRLVEGFERITKRIGEVLLKVYG